MRSGGPRSSISVDFPTRWIDTLVGDRGYRLSAEKSNASQSLAPAEGARCRGPRRSDALTSIESKLFVQGALDAALAGRTSIVIAHRLSTIVTQIYPCLDDGRIVEVAHMPIS